MRRLKGLHARDESGNGADGQSVTDGAERESARPLPHLHNSKRLRMEGRGGGGVRRRLRLLTYLSAPWLTGILSSDLLLASRQLACATARHPPVSHQLGRKTTVLVRVIASNTLRPGDHTGLNTGNGKNLYASTLLVQHKQWPVKAITMHGVSLHD